MLNIFLSVTLLCNVVQSARIVGIFPIAIPSHYILGNALMRGLAEAGHNVTMISPYEEKNPPKSGSYRNVVLTGFADHFNEHLKYMNVFDNKQQSHIKSIVKMINFLNKICDNFFDHENVKNFCNSGEKFDVVIVQQYLNDAFKIIGSMFNVPVIAFSTLATNQFINRMVGNPAPLAYIPHMTTNYSPHMSFFQRLNNGLISLLDICIEHFFYTSAQTKILQKYFSNPPTIQELNQNVSLVLLNSHESVTQAVPFVPNMIQIGGFHIKPPKKLPKDLQNYLDNATEGVIYFSMGSYLKSKTLPVTKRNAILKAFEKRKEKVLWKWEDDNLPGKPPNVKIKKWLPQQDILAHPNVRLFITHSGLLSTTEAVYHGVPILAMPIIADQHTNAQLAIVNGYALSLPCEDPLFSERKLSELLNELLTNPRYRNNARKRSQLFHDKPQKPMETAVYWVEYVIRHGGAPHLKVAGVDLPWYIYHFLDVISFVIVVLFLFLYLFYISIRKFFSYWAICGQKRGSKFKKE